MNFFVVLSYPSVSGITLKYTIKQPKTCIKFNKQRNICDAGKRSAKVLSEPDVSQRSLQLWREALLTPRIEQRGKIDVSNTMEKYLVLFVLKIVKS